MERGSRGKKQDEPVHQAKGESGRLSGYETSDGEQAHSDRAGRLTGSSVYRSILMDGGAGLVVRRSITAGSSGILSRVPQHTGLHRTAESAQTSCTALEKLLMEWR